MNWQEFEEQMRQEAEHQVFPVDHDLLWDKIQQKKKRRPLLLWLFFGLLGTFVFSIGLRGAMKGRLSAISAKTGRQTEQSRANPEQRESRISSTHADSKDQNHENVRDFTTESKSKFRDTDPKHIRSENKTDQSLLYPNSGKNSGENRASVFGKNTLNSMAEQDQSAEILESPLLKNNEITTKLRTDSSLVLSAPPLLHVETVALALLKAHFRPVQFPFTNPNADQKAGLTLFFDAEYQHWGSTKGSEKTLEYFSTGLHIEKKLAKRWSLGIGLLYGQYSSRFDWTKTWLEQRTVATPTFLNNGQQFDDSSAMQTIFDRYTRDVTHYNKIATIAIPVSIQYQLPLKDGSIVPSLGLQTQFQTAAKGMLLNANELPDAAVFALRYKRKMAVALRTELRWDFPLFGRTRGYIGAVGAFDLIPRDSEGERFWSAGVQVGVLRNL